MNLGYLKTYRKFGCVKSRAQLFSWPEMILMTRRPPGNELFLVSDSDIAFKGFAIKCRSRPIDFSCSPPLPFYYVVPFCMRIAPARENSEHVRAFARASKPGRMEWISMMNSSASSLSLSLSLSPLPKKSVCVFSLSSHLRLPPPPPSSSSSPSAEGKSKERRTGWPG